MTRSSAPFVERLRDRTRQLQERILRQIRDPDERCRLVQLHQGFAAATGRLAEPERFAEHYAQAVACTDLAAGLCGLSRSGSLASTAGSMSWFEAVIQDCEFGRNDHPENRFPVVDGPSLTHFYEEFLEGYNAQQKSHHGVYYTPQPVAAFIVRSVHEALREEFGLEGGLADTATWRQMAQRFSDWTLPAGADLDEPFVRILDPALGTGVFLVEVIDVIHRTMVTRWQAEGRSVGDIRQLWRHYVPAHLLPRIFGLELLLPPLAIAHVQVLAKLATTGYDSPAAGLQLYLADTLADPAALSSRASDSWWTREIARAQHVRCEMPITVVVGNPPFSGISDHRGLWINQLLRGRLDGGSGAASYYQVDGRGLGERKLWLQDDYVKFFRYAQWCIERSKAGVIGFVTNHGYLDNATFRGMRQQLIGAFPRFNILDLHGNRKKKESAPGSGRDENVFGVEQGVAVGVFRRPPENKASQIVYGELWGERTSKFATLDASVCPELGGNATQAAVTESGVAWKSVEPRGPNYFFTPQNVARLAEYQRGLLLNDIMPVNSTVVVTARDSFVVAFDKQELVQRMQVFRDLSVPDHEIRQRYFTNGRSKKYPPGDTRGWQLTEARKRMAADDGWQDYVRTCLYRPFDRRSVYWAKWMVDWPRGPIMQHMIGGPNVALIARRQMLPTQACNYFWVSDDITLDGVIRSDNRGSESLFPLYLYSSPANSEQRRANLDVGFIEEISRTLSLEWTDDGYGDLESCFGPDDVLGYFYAQFNSPTYRQRYCTGLRIEFPRVFLPADRKLFCSLCRLGRQLVNCHLASSRAEPLAVNGSTPMGIASGFPKYESGRVFISHDRSIGPVSPAVWRFQAGGHQVCRKWLKDRRRRGIDEMQWTYYGTVLAAIQRTLLLMTAVDDAIADRGGWPQAFLNR